MCSGSCAAQVSKKSQSVLDASSLYSQGRTPGRDATPARAVSFLRRDGPRPALSAGLPLPDLPSFRGRVPSLASWPAETEAWGSCLWSVSLAGAEQRGCALLASGLVRLPGLDQGTREGRHLGWPLPALPTPAARQPGLGQKRSVLKLPLNQKPQARAV